MELSTNPFYTHSSVPDTLDILAGGIIFYLKLLADTHDSSDADPAASKQELENIGKEYGSVFSLVAKCLHDEIPSDSESSVPSLVFYHVAILLQRVVCRMTIPFNSNIIPMDGLLKEGLTTLLQAVAHCRDRMKGRRNEPLETLFEGSDLFHSEKLEKTVLEDISRFSDAWWTEIFKGYERLGLYDPKTMAPSVPLDNAIQPPMSNSTSSLEVAALSPATTSGRHLPENKAAATSVRYSLDNLRNTDSDTFPSDQADRRPVTGIEAEQPCSLDSSQAGFIATGDVLPRDSARGYSIINMDARR
ncbi:hypothetical protein BDN70DRAFT_879919 [Pholiota conissans]|uniref:Uncharacterized protein n=1 Tax=Pholiota conissans TaxID=109636 RepID=A0A9P5Z0K0_9AGAR|nr:hypothetical protein BDN70DRAFT_879919 [Pholiota conissans]